MSEIKRAPLISFGTDKVIDKKHKLVQKSARISLILPESNESTCPVYNYKEELATAKKLEKIRNEIKASSNEASTNGLDPVLEEEDDDVRRIAQEMEAKYGMGPPAKKKVRKGRKDEYADIGAGYDESDSFIDNTDGYDEMIPRNITTLHGGFYINCGALEFKTDDEASSDASSSSSSSSDDSDEDEVPEKSSRKRILETSESEGDVETDKIKDKPMEKKAKMQQNGTNGVAIVKKKKIGTDDKLKLLKKKMGAIDESKKKTVKDLLKEKREETNVDPIENKAAEKLEKGDITMKENKKPMCLSNLADIINSVASGTGNNNNKNEINNLIKKDITDIIDKDVVSIPPIANVVNNKPVLIQSSEGENSRDSTTDPQNKVIEELPDNMSDSILEIVQNIKDTATKNRENNLKTFMSNVNTLLISLERNCKSLGKQTRAKIYRHLGPFMKCSYGTLVRRAKNLIIADDSIKLKELLKDLHHKIDVSMIPLMEIHERDCQKVLQKKREMELLGSNVDEIKHMKLPKRKFIWSEEITKLLKEVILIRKRCFIIDGKTKEALENNLNIYLKTEILNLWPEGWMTIAALLKTCTTFADKKSGLNVSANLTEIQKNKPQKSFIKVKDLTKMQHDSMKMPTDCQMVLKEAQKVHKNRVENPKNLKEIKKVQKVLPEIAKLATNTMLSITPINHEKPKVIAPKSELTINEVQEKIIKKSTLTITPTNNNPIDLIAKPDVIKSEKTLIKINQTQKEPTTFINLSQKSIKPENLSIKPIKPITDHKIENIINLPKPEIALNHIITENIKKDSLQKMENLSKNSEIHFFKTNEQKKLVISSNKLEQHNQKLDNLEKQLLSNPTNHSADNKQHKLIKTHAKRPLDVNVNAKKIDALKSVKIIDLVSNPPPLKRKPEVKNNVSEVSIDTVNTSDLTVVDLTSTPELKRKPGPKSKTFYYDSLINNKPVLNNALSPLGTSSHHESAINSILLENVNDSQQFFNKSRKKDNLSATSTPNPKNIDGDDIMEVMENLKTLQKMSTPIKTSDSLTSSPVSVIAFNKSFSSPTKSEITPKIETKSNDFGMGFQEQFQRQFLQDFNSMKKELSAPAQTAPTSSKNYNSAHSSASLQHQEKYFQPSNNNYTQQNPSKYKNTFPSQQTGAYLMDDMLANFLTEYGYPKTANHKPKPPQK